MESSAQQLEESLVLSIEGIFGGVRINHLQTFGSPLHKADT